MCLPVSLAARCGAGVYQAPRAFGPCLPRQAASCPYTGYARYEAGRLYWATKMAYLTSNSLSQCVALPDYSLAMWRQGDIFEAIGCRYWLDRPVSSEPTGMGLVYDSRLRTWIRYDHFGPAMKRASAIYFPPIALEPGGKHPLYGQLYDWFRTAILDGRLRPGQRVPSTRSLATDLGISRAPVLGAFEQLHAEGYLQTTVGAGTHIATALPEDRTRFPAMRTRSRRGHKRSLRIARNTRALLPRQVEPWFQHTGPFRVSLPALDHFPFNTWSALFARHARRPRLETTGYGDPFGYMPLREAIAEYLGTVRAVRCTPNQVMIVSGSQHGLQVAVRTLLEPGDAVWMEEPGYPGARQVFVSAGVEMVPVPVDAEGLDVKEGLRRQPGARAVYITPSHQYPLGHTMSAARRVQLLDWAARSGAWILEDDYDSEYRFGGRPIASLQGLDADARVIYVGTFSKVLFPALRMGYVVVPEDLIPAFRAAREAVDIFPPGLVQAALADFIKEGHFARHIRRMKMLYAERRKTLSASIRKYMGADIEIVGAEAGMHLVMMLPAGVDDKAVGVSAAAAGIATIPLSTCCLRHPRLGGLVLGYAHTNGEQIHEAVQKLAAIVDSSRRGKP